MKFGRRLLIGFLILFLILIPSGIVVADGCSGLIATGSSVIDGRSIIVKNRHIAENNQKPIFGQGTYSYWGVGDGVNSFCRMGLNEKGLAVANFNLPADDLQNGSWEFISDHSSTSEDDDMRTILGEFSTVREAALWLAQHAYFPSQWIITSQESGIGAVVAMDTNYHSNISWINNTWAAIGNVWYCEQQTSDRIKRVEYLINNLLEKQDAIGVEDTVRLISRDIQASDSNESEPVGYTGNYSAGGLCPSSCNSGISIINGDNRFDGALSMAWIGIGHTTHLSVFFPLGASYVHTEYDIPRSWTIGLGLEQFTYVKQAYAEASPDVYYRERVHEIYNYTLPIQEAIFDRYYLLMEDVKNSSSIYEAQEKMRVYADNTFKDGLQAYIEERPMSLEEGIADEPDTLPLNLLFIFSLVFIISIVVFLFAYLLFRE